MNPKEYVKNVLVTEAKNLAPIQERLSTSRNARLMHSALGLASEISEIREMADKEDIDSINLKEEMGDLNWYMGLPIDELQLDPEQIFPLTRTDANKIGNMSNETKKFYLNKEVNKMQITIGTAIDLLKKSIIYGKDLNVEAYVGHLKDLAMSIEICLNLYGMDGGQARERNIEKLRARYGEKFSEAAALNRDLEKERKVLES